MKKNTDFHVSNNEILPQSFVHITSMTKEETRNHAEILKISYSFGTTPFGKILIASTEKGICSIALALDGQNAMKNLVRMFPKARFSEKVETSHQNIMVVFEKDLKPTEHIKLHLKGTDFQIKVWNSLLGIPFGETVSYGKIAAAISNPKACRAVGSAIGDNPVFYIIPCHRVIQSSGSIGQYYWGTYIKTTILEWEKSRLV